MNGPIDPVEAAVASYLQFLEMGGKAPDFTALAPEVRSRLEGVLDMLELTEGIGLRSARADDDPEAEPRFNHHRTAGLLIEAAGSELEREMLSRLDATLPASAPIDTDSSSAFELQGLPVLARWTVGTLGGRIRVWLIDLPAAADLENDSTHLHSLDRVFRAFPETAAVCLTCRDLNCLLMEPQDCAPVIEVPAGAVTGRRYRRPIQPVEQALGTFIRELVPAWEALPRFQAGTTVAADVTAIAGQAASDAVALQKAAGARARYPKKEVLTKLGEREVNALTEMAIGLYEGTRDPAGIEADLRKLGRTP